MKNSIKYNKTHNLPRLMSWGHLLVDMLQRERTEEIHVKNDLQIECVSNMERNQFAGSPIKMAANCRYQQQNGHTQCVPASILLIDFIECQRWHHNQSSK